MSEPIELNLKFNDIHDFHNHHIDLIRLVQGSIKGEVEPPPGWHTLYLIEGFADKSYELLKRAEEERHTLKSA